MSNEISNEVRAKEIHTKARSYYDVAEQYAYKFLMELKTLRDDRLFRELGYKTFDDYCAEEWSLTRQTVNERIKIADTFGSETEAIASKIGFKKSILLSRFDEETRTDAIENGIPTETGRKPVETATQQEIAAYQRSLKEKEAEIESQRKAKEQAEQAAEIERKERERLEKENAELAAQPKEIEQVYPDDYEKIKRENAEYRAKYGDSEGVRNIDDKKREKVYEEFAQELERLRLKYASIALDGANVDLYASANPEYASKINSFNDFWKMYVKTVSNDQIIIEVESV